MAAMDHGQAEAIASVAALERFCREALAAAGADTATAEAATRAMLHGSRLGVDSHGVRLLDHYVTALGGGRINKKPALRIAADFGAMLALDADHAHGALATYTAMNHALERARQMGLAAVIIRNTSHFGPAGAYALAAADAGFIGIAMCNTDSFVRLHDGAARFHGTNPIACAVPVPGQRPWLFDMATSAITYNRVQLYKSLRQRLPGDVASTEAGENTTDAEQATMLAPLGGQYGFKGAGLAGLVEIFCAVLSGMRISTDILPMGGPDFSTPREMGAFVMAIHAEVMGEPERFAAGMTHYLATLRSSQARDGAVVMAPGDREWAEEARRLQHGVPLDPVTAAAFRRLSAAHGIPLPFSDGAH
jgi:LDH2 family malate/lactate/ureidoglycolate dehydrogenase